jgi:hypothetical protein
VCSKRWFPATNTGDKEIKMLSVVVGGLWAVRDIVTEVIGLWNVFYVGG